MYQSLLTNRYLSSRVIPFIAVAAVALCVALVIIVVSVMTGFLNLVKNSGQTLMGDVVISYPISGIPYYDELIERIEALPDVAGAAPVCDTYGLLKMPYPAGRDKESHTVNIWATDPERFAIVTKYAETIYWRPYAEDDSLREDDYRRFLGREKLDTLLDEGLSLRDTDSDRPGICLGMHVSRANERQRDGSYEPLGDGYWHMPAFDVTLTTIPVQGGVPGEAESFIFPVVNEFVSGVFLIDQQRVIIPLEVGQQMLHLDEARTFNEATGEEGVDPARATMILVRAKRADEYPDGSAATPLTAEQLRDRIEPIYEELRAERGSIMPAKQFGLRIMTWEEQQARFIEPVEKERELMRTLFTLIYIVCAGLVLAIFWSIVFEKTRDIGILRSIGASRLGISWIFIRYGFIVGTLGAVVGFGLGVYVVRNINVIHDAMGNPPMTLAIIFAAFAAYFLAMTVRFVIKDRMFPIALCGMSTAGFAGLAALIIILRHVGGIQIWSPEVYYFERIPNEVDYGSALITMIGAVIFSLIGSFLPAARAADTDPVSALRYE